MVYEEQKYIKASNITCMLRLQNKTKQKTTDISFHTTFKNSNFI